MNSLTLHNAFIPISSSVTDLGLNYSTSFNFSEHIMVQIAKARKLSSLIIRSFRLPSARIILFKSHIRPIVEYCAIIYSNIRKCYRVQLEKIQRTFTKSIINSSMSHRQRCISLQISPLWLRRILLNLVFLFRLKYNLAHSCNGPVTFSNNKGYNLRKKDFLFYVPFCRSPIRSNFFLTKYSQLWNTLSESIRSCTSIAHFHNLTYNHITPEYIFSTLKPPCTIDTLYEEGPHGF